MLKEINVPLWSHEKCNGALQTQFGPAYHLPDTAVCAGAEGRDACDVSVTIWLIYVTAIAHAFESWSAGGVRKSAICGIPERYFDHFSSVCHS